ncbi:PhzF family phenazine biosynthesis protein [Halomonas icarae]|uniref:PhzF family phenazine biosynthesis isomerase n=1 Tax=Halomonas icarae TaxID=2691040 RepID=A0A7X4VZ99_9GAMM|nr:PhzF family phenazine biosynthesis protein [Halomonas icarae]MDR5901637.1 PhzF family phenazine biosynthesis protein [Halomonas icarae]NAW12986.1 PhzF family phenazine biosynthesis isomerase [Halomonas icarae]
MAEYFLLDVFADRAFAGNPLAVFPRAEGLATDTMQAIANELNLSETVFVGEATGWHRYPVRIFTPTRELPFAGHPVIGTAHLLVELSMAERDRSLTLDAGVGPLVVEFDRTLASFTTAAPFSISSSTLNQTAVAQLLGLAAQQTLSEPVLASCGLPYHLIELASQEALERARPSPSAWAEWVSPSGHDQVYLYVVGKETGASRVVRARMFSTEGGVREDSATGSAAAALAGHLAQNRRVGRWRWQIEQGIEMGRPSRILAEAERAEDDLTIRIAGEAVIVGRGSLHLPG